MIPVRILGASSRTPGTRVSTEEIATRTGVMNAAELERRTGIATRIWTEPSARISSLGARVLSDALSASNLNATDLRRLIFVGSTGADDLIPATANLIAEEIGARGCDCFDVNNACVGFLTALDLAARSVATGLGPVGIVVAEVLSRFIDRADMRPYAVLADGTAAVIIGAGGPEGILSSHLARDAGAPHAISLRHPGVTGKKETIRFEESSDRISRAAIELIRAAVDRVLGESGLSLSQIEWVLPHQPNGRLLGEIVRALELREDRVLPLAHELGSVGAASIPISLDRLLRSGRVRPFDRVLMAAVGAGVAYGAFLYQFGAELPRSGSKAED